MNHFEKFIYHFYKDKVNWWLLILFFGLMVFIGWTGVFLNSSAFSRVWVGFFNTIYLSVIVVVMTIGSGWLLAWLFSWGEMNKQVWISHIIRWIITAIRSVPQLILLLVGLMVMTVAIQNEWLTGSFFILLGFSFLISFVVVPDVTDMLLDRITYFRQSDFVSAMRLSGISDHRILNIDIIWKNGRLHLLNHSVIIFSTSVFLLCSLDFILSVGLSTSVSAVNFPHTMGSVLAKMDSKQDILMISTVLSNPSYIGDLFIRHLQGISTAGLIVFILITLNQLGNAIAGKFKL